MHLHDVRIADTFGFAVCNLSLSFSSLALCNCCLRLDNVACSSASVERCVASRALSLAVTAATCPAVDMMCDGVA